MTDVIVQGPTGPRRIWIREHPAMTGLAVLLLALIALVIWRVRQPAAADETAAAVVQAETDVAQVGPFDVTVVALGTVEPRPGAEARVAAPAPTVIKAIHVAEGQIVRAGDPLVDLDASVFEARVRQAEVAAQAAQRAYDRAQRLVEGGISPRKDQETAEADLARANADLAEARRVASLAVLRSPIAGVVTSLDVALSQPVDANQSLVQIVNLGALAVLFRLSPKDAARITRGAAAALSEPSSAGEAGAALGEGTVEGISAAVDSASGGVEVRVVVNNPARALRVGEQVSGRITVATHPNAITVPVAALVPGEDGTHVFVVDAEGIAHQTPVEVGERSETEAEITSGLQGRERIVTDGAYSVSDKAKIEKPKEAGAADDDEPEAPSADSSAAPAKP